MSKILWAALGLALLVGAADAQVANWSNQGYIVWDKKSTTTAADSIYISLGGSSGVDTTKYWEFKSPTVGIVPPGAISDSSTAVAFEIGWSNGATVDSITVQPQYVMRGKSTVINANVIVATNGMKVWGWQWHNRSSGLDVAEKVRFILTDGDVVLTDSYSGVYVRPYVLKRVGQ